MKKLNVKLLSTIILFLLHNCIVGQVGINTTGAAPHPSAILDVSSANKGLLMPQNANPGTNIASPAAGLMAYNTSTNTPNFYNGTSWQNLGGSPLPSNLFPNSVNFGSPTNIKYDGSSVLWDVYYWTVPAGISKAWFEMWSSGGSGNIFGLTQFEQVGGESGGYLSATGPLSAGEILTILVAKGKNILGDAIGIATIIIRANDSYMDTSGKNFTLNQNCSLINFSQRNLGELIKYSNYFSYNNGSEPIEGHIEAGCEGGDAPFGGKGGKSVSVNVKTELTGSPSPSMEGLRNYTISSEGGFPGGGGGRGYYGFGAGGNGFVIIHY